MLLYNLVFVCALFREATCLMRNIKPASNGKGPITNDTITPRDLFARQSCDPGYGLCDTGSCCPSDSQCCSYGCAPAEDVCCGDSGTCPNGNTCCTYNCALPNWGCCDTGYAAPLDADCCADGGYCPSGTYCVNCDDGIEGCCDSPYSVSSYPIGTESSVYVPPVQSSEPTSSSEYSPGGGFSSYNPGGGYSYYYTWFTWSWYFTWRTAETLTSTETITSTYISVYASNTYDAQTQFSSLESVAQSIASAMATFSSNPYPSSTGASASTGGVGRGTSPMWVGGDAIGICMMLFAGTTGIAAILL